MQAPLLELRNIGKIYVSESNVSVGIRGVNLSFERGEFVAVTGKSGSGKSTLLNVISGMDTYEEGELYVEGESTSHFMQKDWEEYRKQYVSFIFQDYNILESFTVLQNVELALMHIENPRERRERAMELLRRVGLEGHIHHKGSKLSGGQKQRTVIARALAKDSPILLCDEPTGNLDSKSSGEIIELLREVSKDKLVIIVTHNFEQVEHHATRHIRIFDGAIESDHVIRAEKTPVAPPSGPVSAPSGTRRVAHTLAAGLHLGRIRFAATPKLSVFLCILMVLTALILTLITSLTYDSRTLFDEQTMFTHVPGRVVIVRQDGAVITDEELEKLAEQVGASDHLHYDNMLDETVGIRIGDDYDWMYHHFSFGYPVTSVTPDEGRSPEAVGEVLMEIPVSLKVHMGDGGFAERDVELFGTNYRVVGVKYFYDNTREPRLLFTEEGYKVASALAYFYEQSHNFSYSVELYEKNAPEKGTYQTSFSDTFVDLTMEEGTYFINSSHFTRYMMSFLKENPHMSASDLGVGVTLTGSFFNYYYEYEYWDMGRDVAVMPGYGYGEEGEITYSFDKYTRVNEMTEAMKTFFLTRNYHDQWDEENNCMGNVFAIVLSPDILLDFMHECYYNEAYTQASLFFENDRVAHGKVETLRELGYTAVVTDETVESDVFEMLEEKLAAFFMGVLWLLAILFITMFLSLCSSRAMNATRGDVAIMRSMGIPTAVVKISIYVQTLLSLIPAVLVTAAACTAVYIIPKTNGLFPFLHGGDYALVAVVLLLIALNLSRKYVKKMFDQSVKKTLKGGSKQ